MNRCALFDSEPRLQLKLFIYRRFIGVWGKPSMKPSTISSINDTDRLADFQEQSIGFWHQGQPHVFAGASEKFWLKGASGHAVVFRSSDQWRELFIGDIHVRCSLGLTGFGCGCRPFSLRRGMRRNS